MKIGEKLKVLRNLKGFTQEEVALKLKMERRSYSNLENNTTKIDLSRLCQIAAFYEIEIDTLLTFTSKQIFEDFLHKSNNLPSENTLKEDQVFFIEQIKLLIDAFSEERKIFLEIVEDLKIEIGKSR